jgi:VCBS repeat-containing protein
MSWLWALLLLTCAPSMWAQSPPAVRFLGAPAPAFTSGITFPIGLAADTSGNVYIAEYSGNAVYKETLQSNGSFVRSTVASGFPFGPVGLAIDSVGNVFIGIDIGSANSSLVKETLQGNGSYVQSYIGTSLEDVYGIVVDSSGNVYATSSSPSQAVRKFIPSAGAYTSTVIFTSPGGILAGLALDNSGNLFVAKEYASTVYKLTPTGNPVTTTTYTSSSITTAATSAFGVTVDSAGDLYIADTSGYLRLETPNGGSGYTATTLASGIGSSYGVAISSAGVIYFGASGAVDNFSPAAVNLGTRAIATTSSATTLNYTIQSGTVVGAINVVSQGVVATQSGSPEFVKSSGGTCTAQTYSGITTCSINVTFTPQFPGLRTGAVEFLDGSGNVQSTAYLYGVGTAPVAAFSAGTTSLLSVSGLGATPLNGPRGPVTDAAGNLFVADSLNNRILKIAPGGAATVLSTPGITLSNPAGVAIDGAGNLYIADSGNGRVVELSAQGVASVLSTNSLALSTNSSVAVDGLANVYTTDATNNRVLVFPRIGTTHVLAITGVTLGSVSGVAADGSGNIFIADESNSHIVKVNNGTGTVLGTGSLSGALLNPEAVTVDAVGNVYVADTGNNRMVEISAGTTNGLVLGTGSYALALPNGAAVGNTGNLFICDGSNDRIVISNQKAPAALTFSAPAAIDAVSLLNLGNSALTLPVPGSGHNPGFGTANFTLVNAGNSGYCPQLSTTSSSASLAAGANCRLSVEFSPAAQATGTLTDTLTITDNTLGVAASTQLISLTGTALTTPTVSLTPSPASPIAYGQAATSLSAVLSFASGAPTGTVSFFDNSASLGSPVALTGSAASLPAGYYLPGSHSFQADYSGDANFNPANSAAVSYLVNKASSTLSPPAGTVQVPDGTTGSVTVTITGQHIGAGIATPSGTIGYSILNSGSTVVASGTASISSGTASIPVANTMAAGLYTVSLSYAGDANYNAAAAANAALHVGATIPVISWAQPSPITNGTSLNGILDATAASGSTAVAGNFSYTAAPTGGSAAAVTAATVLSAGSYVLTASFTPTNQTVYATATGSVTLLVGSAAPALSWARPAAISYGTPLAAVLDATATFNSVTVAGTFSYTALAAGGTATAVTGATLLPAGAYTLTATFNPADTTRYSAANTSTSLTVNLAGSSVQLASSVNPVLLLNPTTLTATVSSTAGAPSGTVVFLDGATPLGSASLSLGVATLTVTNLAVGSHSLSAAYSGVTNFTASASSPLTEVVINFTAAPTGSGSSGPSQTVNPGGAATFSLQIVPTAGASFPTVAVLTLSGLPPGATTTVSPASWAQTSATSWTYPANTPLTNVALTIQLPSGNARMDRTYPLRRELSVLWCLLLFPFSWSLRRKFSRLPQTFSTLLLLALGLLVVSGCGSGNGFFNQRSQTYTITTTVSAGALSHSATLTLTVE